MVEGLKKAIVVDLDGTLVSCNSMVVFTRWAAATMLRKGLIVSAMKIMLAVAKRKLRLYNHATMKQRILVAVATKLSPTEINRFIHRKLLPKVNPNVTNLITELRTNHPVLILATAAPALYANQLGDKIGATATTATPTASAQSTESEYTDLENKGEVKLRNTQSLLAELNAELSVVITDHSDDLPLLRANSAGQNYIVDTHTLIICKYSE